MESPQGTWKLAGGRGGEGGVDGDTAGTRGNLCGGLARERVTWGSQTYFSMATAPQQRGGSEEGIL